MTINKTTYLFWDNKDMTYYLYKVRAKNSPLYYIGIKSLNLPLEKVSKDYCSNDGYFGSGKTKEFSDFIEENKGSLYKEILAIETNRAKAYNKEKELLSDLYLSDKNCLNASAGGLDPKVFYSIEECSIHGETKFIGKSCHKCSNSKNVSIKDCDKHGLVKHLGGACYFCRNEKIFTEEHCEKHGLVSHLKGACIRCKRSIQFNKKTCTVHGDTLFNGNDCVKCRAKKRNFRSRNCKKCLSTFTPKVGNQIYCSNCK